MRIQYNPAIQPRLNVRRTTPIKPSQIPQTTPSQTFAGAGYQVFDRMAWYAPLARTLAKVMEQAQSAYRLNLGTVKPGDEFKGIQNFTFVVQAEQVPQLANAIEEASGQSLHPMQDIRLIFPMGKIDPQTNEGHGMGLMLQRYNNPDRFFANGSSEFHLDESETYSQFAQFSSKRHRVLGPMTYKNLAFLTLDTVLKGQVAKHGPFEVNAIDTIFIEQQYPHAIGFCTTQNHDVRYVNHARAKLHYDLRKEITREPIPVLIEYVYPTLRSKLMTHFEKPPVEWTFQEPPAHHLDTGREHGIRGNERAVLRMMVQNGVLN